MNQIRRVIKMSLGGAVFGVLWGTLGGAFVGILHGTCLGDFSFALDGAMLGVCMFTFAGAVVGAILGLCDEKLSVSRPRVGKASERLHRGSLGVGPGIQPLPTSGRRHWSGR